MVPFSGLTSEQESLREIAARFAADKIRPVAPGLDERAELPIFVI